VFILKILKVVCFETFLQVFILKLVSEIRFCGRDSRVAGGECEAAARARRGWSAMFTAHLSTLPACSKQARGNDSSGSTRRQLVGRTVEVQVVNVSENEAADSTVRRQGARATFAESESLLWHVRSHRTNGPLTMIGHDCIIQI
jgi:hypothetical protein